jgi:hypothetical protein
MGQGILTQDLDQGSVKAENGAHDGVDHLGP